MVFRFCGQDNSFVEYSAPCRQLSGSRFNDSTALWMFEDELAAVRGSYRRERLLRLSSPD
jgi:hypothetical protein